MKKARSAPSGLSRTRQITEQPQTPEHTHGRRGGHALRIAAVVAVVLAGAMMPAGAIAQDINEAVTIEDLGLTQRLHPGARPAGMAGAYTAIANDNFALAYNPAGLARIRKVELSIGFQHSQYDYNNAFYGNESFVELSSTTLDNFGISYPIPTYRGSLVLAFGAYRTSSADIDILNVGFNTDTSTFDEYRLQQSGSILSYNFGIAGDISPNLSAGLNLFIMDGKIDALTQFSFTVPPPTTTGDFEGLFLVDDAEVDLDGYGARLGIQYHLFRFLHFGLAATSQVPVNIRGNAVTEETSYFLNTSDSLGIAGFTIDTDYKLPMRFDAGLSLSLLNLIVSADAGYQDWRQAEVNGFKLRDRQLAATFREVLELRFGAEFRIPFTPVRLRAGYAYLPYPLKQLQADRIEGDAITPAETTLDFDSLPNGLELPDDQQLISAGLGFILGRVLTIDLALEHMAGERTIPTLRDHRDRWRGVMTASYRF